MLNINCDAMDSKVPPVEPTRGTKRSIIIAEAPTLAELDAIIQRMQQRLQETEVRNEKLATEMRDLRATAETTEGILQTMRKQSQNWRVGYVPCGYINVRESKNLHTMLFGDDVD